MISKIKVHWWSKEDRKATEEQIGESVYVSKGESLEMTDGWASVSQHLLYQDKAELIDEFLMTNTEQDSQYNQVYLQLIRQVTHQYCDKMMAAAYVTNHVQFKKRLSITQHD